MSRICSAGKTHFSRFRFIRFCKVKVSKYKYIHISIINIIEIRIKFSIFAKNLQLQR